MLGSSVHFQHDNFHMYLWKNDTTFGTSPRGSLDPFVNWYKCADGKWLMLKRAPFGEDMGRVLLCDGAG